MSKLGLEHFTITEHHEDQGCSTFVKSNSNLLVADRYEHVYGASEHSGLIFR